MSGIRAVDERYQTTATLLISLTELIGSPHLDQRLGVCFRCLLASCLDRGSD